MGSVGANSWYSISLCIFLHGSIFRLCLFNIPGSDFLICTCDSGMPLWSHGVLSWLSLVSLCLFVSCCPEFCVIFLPSFFLSAFSWSVRVVFVCDSCWRAQRVLIGVVFWCLSTALCFLGLGSLLRLLLVVSLRFVLFSVFFLCIGQSLPLSCWFPLFCPQLFAVCYMFVSVVVGLTVNVSFSLSVSSSIYSNLCCNTSSWLLMCWLNVFNCVRVYSLICCFNLSSRLVCIAVATMRFICLLR